MDDILRRLYPTVVYHLARVRRARRHHQRRRQSRHRTNQRADVCPLCEGAGFVRRNVPLDHPDFGKAFPCDCVIREREEERLARLQRYSHLGPLTRLTFGNLISRGRSSNPRDQERFQRCVEDAQAFAEAPAGWLVLSGPSGCGKTHVAAAITNRCLELGTPALFVIVPDLLDDLRAAYHPDSAVGYDETFELVRNAPVLILDDLGGQSCTPGRRRSSRRSSTIASMPACPP